MSTPTRPTDAPHAPPGQPAPPPGSGREPAEGPRSWVPLAVTVGLSAVAVAVVGVLEPAIITAPVRSPQALAIVAGIVAATVGWSAILRRIVGSAAVRTILVLAPVAVVLGLYVAPYFGEDQVVDQELPGLEQTAAAGEGAPDPDDDVAPGSATAPADTPADTEGTAADPADTPPADTAAPADAAPADTPPAPAAPGAPAGPTAPDAPADPTAPAAAPAPAPGPVELSRGSFVGLDGHSAVGDAAIYSLEDGSRIVRLDDVELQRVPEPYVYLVPGADQTAPVEGAVDLGALAGNVGSSNYPIPSDVDLTGEWTVLVWCEPFASPVGAATQLLG